VHPKQYLKYLIVSFTPLSSARILLLSADYTAKMIAEVLDTRCDWPGHFKPMPRLLY
jgi:hypothetical protein